MSKRATGGYVDTVDTVDTAQTTGPAPYERDVDTVRVVDCTCITCGEEARLFMEAGRSRPWQHDDDNAAHVVEYWRVDR